MKKILLGSFALISFSFLATAQKNNPFDGFGKEFVASIQIIDNDFNAGKIKQIDDLTLAYYSKNIPLKTQISLELAGEVFKKLKEYPLSDIVEKSHYSPFGKQILEKMIQKEDLMSLVEQVNMSAVSQSEKDNLLKLLAFGYNVSFYNNEIARHSTLGGGMYFIGGFLLGEAICGPVCGAAGAVIGCFIEYIK